MKDFVSPFHFSHARIQFPANFLVTDTVTNFFKNTIKICVCCNHAFQSFLVAFAGHTHIHYPVTLTSITRQFSRYSRALIKRTTVGQCLLSKLTWLGAEKAVSKFLRLQNQVLLAAGCLLKGLNSLAAVNCEYFLCGHADVAIQNGLLKCQYWD